MGLQPIGTESKEGVVYLENTQARLFHLPDTTKVDETRNIVRVLNDGKPVPPSRPREKDGAPLMTTVDRSYWEKASKHPQVRVWLRKGWIRVHERGSITGAGDLPSTLMHLNAKTAITLIEGETNLALLTEWLEGEARDEVKESIRGRLSVLQMKGAKR